MKLPNLSFMMRVGQLRYVQSRHERGELRNPDRHVEDLLTPAERLLWDLRGRFFIKRLRAEPFYRYVCARTKFYDLVFLDAIGRGYQHIVNIGCGSDTRAYRFAHILRQKGMRVLECDQADAIAVKQRIITQVWPSDHVEFMALDLNDPRTPELRSRLESFRSGRTLVMLEGVSPYIEESSFQAFLTMLGQVLAPESELAYDFKLPDVAKGFGSGGRTKVPFRLPNDRAAVAARHAECGLLLTHYETSCDLTQRLAPTESAGAASPFREDVLTRYAIR